MITAKDVFSYPIDAKYSTSVAYFSMEFAIDQALKVYSGGLGFLAGSHLRSAYELKQNLVGVGILWKYGYYDQERDIDACMKPSYIEKNYSFLEDTGIVFTVKVHDAPVHVKVWFLPPEVFKTAPLFLLSTDIPENDDAAKSITHRLYDSNEATRIAQSIVLGIGGAMLLDILNLDADVYHMNEGHAVCLNFYLYSKYKSLEEIRKRVVFTTHTPESAGNEEHRFSLLKDMSFFYHLQVHEVKYYLGLEGENFNYTLAALKFSRKANAVSQLHGQVSREMWIENEGICEITAITNAQNKTYWKDDEFENALLLNDDIKIRSRKNEMKKDLFKIVANQCGKIFKEDVLTLVWARRFATYKRADLLMLHWKRFLEMVNDRQYPIQIIWAGKPYPEDMGAIAQFNHIMARTKPLANCAVLTGYELQLSAYLKRGSDVWLNNPRMYREASGTSGMTAAMNGSVNLSLPDGWVPEFALDGENCFIVKPAPDELSQEEKDRQESAYLLDVLTKTVLPTYYENHKKWLSIVKKASADVFPAFDSGRMANEYYEKLYTAE